MASEFCCTVPQAVARHALRVVTASGLGVVDSAHIQRRGTAWTPNTHLESGAPGPQGVYGTVAPALRGTPAIAASFGAPDEVESQGCLPGRVPALFRPVH